MELLKLYPYQLAGSIWLSMRRRAYLADAPGLGKTAQVIRAIMTIQGETGSFLKTLVVCPAAAIPVWEAEWEKWWPQMSKRLRPRIVSYTKLTLCESCQDVKYDLVVLDEAHYVKSPRAKRTKAALKVAAAADRAWLLSGTPMPNNPSELFTVFAGLWPHSIPLGITKHIQWLDYFCEWYQGEHGPRVTGTKNVVELRNMLRPIMARRRIQDVGLQLPPLRLHVVPLPADRRFAEELETLANEQGDLHTPTVRRLLGAHKAPRIAKIVGDERISPVVLMYHHKDTGRALRASLIVRGWRCYGFDGSHTPGQRAAETERFQKDPKGPKVFIVQQQAGGVSISLTAASEIILVEPDWSPGVNAQAIKRVHRIGSTDPVRARLFYVMDSLDENIMETLATKIRMRKEVFSGAQRGSPRPN